MATGGYSLLAAYIGSLYIGSLWFLLVGLVQMSVAAWRRAVFITYRNSLNGLAMMTASYTVCWSGYYYHVSADCYAILRDVFHLLHA